ncbi:hypothetical protein [Euzebya sp.]|uniref:hypothetical protein n=1 Tax=Euzebya sp. TaxID=1971409 RepID=UPI00351127A8
MNAQVIAEAKAVPCTDCGRWWHPYQLDFDHVRDTKDFDIGSARNHVPTERLVQEIAKCEVVCAVCHRVRTAARAAERRSPA